MWHLSLLPTFYWLKPVAELSSTLVDREGLVILSLGLTNHRTMGRDIQSSYRECVDPWEQKEILPPAPLAQKTVFQVAELPPTKQHNAGNRASSSHSMVNHCFIPQLLVECLLCTGQYPSTEETAVNKTVKGPALLKLLTFQQRTDNNI